MTHDGSGVARRTVLLGMAALPIVAACSPSATGRSAGPDPLIALADAARADAARAGAVASSSPDLAPRLGPLRDARTRHAAALDAEVTRLDPSRATATPAAAPPTGGVTPAALRSALAASAQQAATAALTVAAARAGLVASVAACCAAYAEALA